MEHTRSRDSSAGRDAIKRFSAFYDFAFPRVYRFAQRRMVGEAQAQALCRLILVRAIGSLGVLENDELRDPAESAFRLYCLACHVADQVAETPELLDDSGAFSDEREAAETQLFLENPRPVLVPVPPAGVRVSPEKPFLKPSRSAE